MLPARSPLAIVFALLAGLTLIACANGSVARQPPPTALPQVGQAAPTPVMSATPTHPSTAPSPVLIPEPWGAPPVWRGSPAPSVSAVSAVVVDEASASVLYGKDANRRLPPASLTKIATAIVALQDGSLVDLATVDVDSRQMRTSSRMGLLPGDRFSLRDLLYGTMLPSGNDAALAVGRHVAGSDAAFVMQMNELAAKLGLTETRFANPHGLSARDHLSSARDLALLARYAMSIPGFAELVAARSWTAAGSRAIELTNINTFLTTYPGADGIKTGYTHRAGHTMVASATRGGHRVYVVLLNAPSLDEDARKLMDWAFAAFEWPL